MAKLQLRGQWNDLKSQVKNTFPNLTEEDLLYTQGFEEDLVNNLVKKTGKDKQELVQWLNELSPQLRR